MAVWITAGCTHAIWCGVVKLHCGYISYHQILSVIFLTNKNEDTLQLHLHTNLKQSILNQNKATQNTNISLDYFPNCISKD